MEQKAIEILDQNRLMALATIRADGWPQNTMVGYANDGLLLYFVVSRQSQKFANIQQDDRVSLVVGRDFHDPATINALSMAARASEVTDAKQRDQAVELLLQRHPGLARLERPAAGHSAVMRAYPEIVTILDYSKDLATPTCSPCLLAEIEMAPARDDDWGFGAELKPVS